MNAACGLLQHGTTGIVTASPPPPEEGLALECGLVQQSVIFRMGKLREHVVTHRV